MSNYFISIAGNIGVGKSTLVKLLADKVGWEAVLEAVTENPYLEDFYSDMERWSFHSQVFFLTRRIQQHNDLLHSKRSVLQDRSVYEDAEIFARNLYRQSLMSSRDWESYFELYRTLVTMLDPPDLVIYLRASVPTLQRRIEQRGRTYEQQITTDYLTQLNQLYDEWAAGFSQSPVLIVDTDNLDYVQYDDHLEQIWQRIMNRLQGRDYLALS
ncbi:MAG: deoxynucleoside kinase [Chloroflexota bacterium]